MGLCISNAPLLETMLWKQYRDSPACQVPDLMSHQMVGGAHLVPSHGTIQKMVPQLGIHLGLKQNYFAVPIHAGRTGAMRVIRECKRDSALQAQKAEDEWGKPKKF